MDSATATRETAVGGRTSGLLALGDEVTWRARHFGVWMHLTSRITAYERPARFRDSMVRGPLRRMEHDHDFDDDGRGGTVMRDRFEIVAPCGALGRLAERAILARHFRRFLETRNRRIREIAESGAWRRFAPGS